MPPRVLDAERLRLLLEIVGAAAKKQVHAHANIHRYGDPDGNRHSILADNRNTNSDPNSDPNSDANINANGYRSRDDPPLYPNL